MYYLAALIFLGAERGLCKWLGLAAVGMGGRTGPSLSIRTHFLATVSQAWREALRLTGRDWADYYAQQMEKTPISKAISEESSIGRPHRAPRPGSKSVKRDLKPGKIENRGWRRIIRVYGSGESPWTTK